jgi:hypothetical protein
LPAIPAAPAPAIWVVTFTVTVSYPSLDMVTTTSPFREIRKLLGVVPVRPLDRRTWAPLGSDSTTSASWVPRVIVAQPQSIAAAMASDAGNSFLKQARTG